MKKMGLLCLALVMALGAMGIAYAHWTETLEIEGDLNTGWIDVNFMSQYDNDVDLPDPIEAGSWDFEDPTKVEWIGARDPEGKNVASTTSTYGKFDGQLIPVNPSANWAKILVTNGYPCYWGSVAWDLKNHGSVPVELWKVTLVQISKGITPTVMNKELEIGVRYFVDVESGRVNERLQKDDDFSFILSAHGLGQLDPITWDPALWNTVGYLDVTVHIEQDAEQKQSYDFVIEYLFANWNEVNEVP